MAFLKRTLRRPGVQAGLARLLAAYVRILRTTARVERPDDETLQRLVSEERPLVLCFWHGRMVATNLAWRDGSRTHLVISRSRDGTLGARVAQLLGFNTIAGSAHRGGSAAARSMLRLLARPGEMIGVMPDGPRGPRMRARRGAITIARLGRARLIPLAAAARPRLVFGSWDRFVLPLPFARVVLRVGRPIEVPEDAGRDTEEALRLQLERALNELCHEADTTLHVQATEPAPLPPGSERAKS